MHRIQPATEAHQPDKQHARPIEVDSRDVHAVGPGTPEEGPAGIHKSGDIDRQAPAAERPARVGQRLFTEALERDTTHRDEVGRHQGDGGEGQDGVEGDGAADVDE